MLAGASNTHNGTTGGAGGEGSCKFVRIGLNNARNNEVRGSHGGVVSDSGRLRVKVHLDVLDAGFP